MDELLVTIQDAANTIATPNWADIMSVVFSLLAIIVAGFVAWRQNEISRKQSDIADKQNRIALFEKRFEIYNILLCCHSSVFILKLLRKDEDILKNLFIIFAKDSLDDREFNRNEAVLYLTRCCAKLQCATFVFPEKIASLIIDVSARLTALVKADPIVDGLEKYHEKQQRYFQAASALIENGVFIRMEAEMQTI